MKRNIFISSLFLFSSLSAADLYLGIDSGYGMMSQERENNFHSISEDFNAIATNIKVGYGDSNGLSAELFYGFNILDFEYKDETMLHEVGLNLKYGVELVKNLNFFVLAGASYGFGELDLIENSALYQESDLSSESFLSYKGGLGLNYRIDESFELLTGVDYIYRDYEDMTISQSMPPLGIYEYTQSKFDSGITMYIGVNFYFSSKKQNTNLGPNDEFADLYKD